MEIAAAPAPADTRSAPVHDPLPPQLSRRRKAAVIVHLLLQAGVKLNLTNLPEHLQEDLAREMASIRLVDRATVEAVATEFVTILSSIGLSAPGDAAAALAVLSDHLSPSLVRRLQDQIDAQKGRDPWLRVLTLPNDELATILAAESIPVGAVLLSKLPVARAAEVLGALPGERARRITLAVGRTAEITPDAVRRIGEALVEDYCQSRNTAFDKPPVDRIGAILNSTPATTREDMLAGLSGEDEELARNVRKAIFTFTDIPARMKPTDIPGALRDIEQADLITAIAYAETAGGDVAAAADHILANISQRMAGQLRDEAAERGAPKPVDGEKALNAIAATVKGMADAGTISLLDPEAEAA